MLRTLLGECGAIEAERFIDLVIAAVDAWEADAIVSGGNFDRRGFDQGYHGGKEEAYSKIAQLLRIYPLVKKTVTPRKTGNDA